MRKIEEYLEKDIVIRDGRIVDLRPHKNADVKAKLVTPGLFDAHTHIPFVGSRAKEFYMRARGKTYLEILQAGGGIHYTSHLVRLASEDELYSVSASYIAEFTKHGVVGIECKSGYGLDKENELKQLRVIKQLKETLPNKIASTFLGLHAKPKEKSVGEYISEMEELLAEISKERLADFVDVFCDKGAYLPEEIEDFLKFSKSLGFKIRLHADEIENVGAARFGARLEAVSVDHVLKVTKEDIQELSNSNTMVTLMPNTSFYLGESFAPAREIIDSGIPVALGSDFNPGSAPIFMPSFVMHLAIRFLKMEPEEVLTAYTVNSAHLLGFDSGLVRPGYPADLVLWKTNEFLNIPYMWQENFVEHVLINGRMVV
ncbi:imidazolonepropionase [Fervidobacterium islandicum]|uniref:imidazolonepropionase n=1 Tax=Fervidobacterium islandicum TaxID=2423 RepID=UPI003A6603C4